MNVYFDNIFRGQHRDEEPLRRIDLNWKFAWEEIEGMIPAIYIGRKGIVMDICQKAAIEKISSFLKKWVPMAETRDLSDRELEQLEQENPLNTDFSVGLTVNNQVLMRGQRSGVFWYPPEITDDTDKNAVELMEAYACDRNFAWGFIRTSYRWTKEMTEPQYITLNFQAKKVPCEGEHFVTKSGCNEHSVNFFHPITGAQYQLTIYSCEPMELERDEEMIKQWDLEFPTYYHMLKYSVIPETVPAEFRLTDYHRGDNARKISPKGKTAASATVIGGWDGPTSILADKISLKENVYTAYSSVYFEVQSQVEWCPVFQLEKRADYKLEGKVYR